MDAAFSTSVDTIVAELEKISLTLGKLGVPDQHAGFKLPAVHAAMKSFKCLVGELVGVVGQVTRLVEPVVACGGSCGTPAVEIDQVQQDAKSGCLVISNNRSVADRSQVPIHPAEQRRKDPGLSDAQIACDAIRENLGVSVDPSEIEHSRQLSDFSISVKLSMSGRESAWHRTCQAMYRKPKRTGESVPSTYVTFNVTKSRNHILWCVRRLKKDSKSPICAFYTDHRGQISVKVKADGPKIRLTYFTPDKKSTRPVTIFSEADIVKYVASKV